MLFAMVTQLSLINLSHMKQVPDYNTLNHGSVPGGFAPSAAPSLTCRQRRGPVAGLCVPRVNRGRKSHHVPGWL